MSADAFPPGLTPDLVDRIGHLLRQAAGRAFIQKPVNPYELETAAAALLGIKPPHASEFHDTRQPVERLVVDGLEVREMTAGQLGLTGGKEDDTARWSPDASVDDEQRAWTFDDPCDPEGCCEAGWACSRHEALHNVTPVPPAQRTEGREGTDLVQLKETPAYRRLKAAAFERTVGAYIAGAGD